MNLPVDGFVPGPPWESFGFQPVVSNLTYMHMQASLYICIAQQNHVWRVVSLMVSILGVYIDMYNYRKYCSS